MVKPLRSSLFKLPLVLIIGMFIYLLVKAGCSRETHPWQLDHKFSRHLTIMAPEYKKMTGSEISGTVDALSIYKVTSKSYQWYGLGELFKKELVFETKDKHYINGFILAAQERTDIDDSNGCWADIKKRESDKFYVVMLDNTIKRAGYFLATFCKSQGKEYGMILVPDSSGFGPIVYHNESLIPIFRTMVH